MGRLAADLTGNWCVARHWGFPRSVSLLGVHDGVSSVGCRVRVTPARSFFGWATLWSFENAFARRTGLVWRSEGATITAS